MIMELRKKAQVTIPKEVVARLGLKEGDKLDITEQDGVIRIMPVVVYPKKYVDSLKDEIAEIKEDIASGKRPIFNNIDEMFQQIEREQADGL